MTERVWFLGLLNSNKKNLEEGKKEGLTYQSAIFSSSIVSVKMGLYLDLNHKFIFVTGFLFPCSTTDFLL